MDSTKQFLKDCLQKSNLYKEWKADMLAQGKSAEIDFDVEIYPDVHDENYKRDDSQNKKLYIKNHKHFLANQGIVVRFAVRELSDQNYPRLPTNVKKHLEDCLHKSKSREEIEVLVRGKGKAKYSEHVRVSSVTVIDDYEIEIENHKYYGIQKWHIQLLSMYFMLTYPRFFQFSLQGLVASLATCILYSTPSSLSALLVISAIVFIYMAIGSSLTAVVLFGKLINFRDDDFLSFSKSEG